VAQAFRGSLPILLSLLNTPQFRVFARIF